MRGEVRIKTETTQEREREEEEGHIGVQWIKANGITMALDHACELQ